MDPEATDYDLFLGLSYFLDFTNKLNKWSRPMADRYVRRLVNIGTPLIEYQADTIVVYPPNAPDSSEDEADDKASQKSGISWSEILKKGAEIAIPVALELLLADNRPLDGLDLQPTTEAVESKVESILKQLKSGVESIQQSDQFRLFLATMGKFHDYSIGNMILIMLQKPSATHVAGFNTWKDLGRYVKAGEKGIAILAPVMPPRPICEKCGARLPRNAKYCPKCGAEVDPGEKWQLLPATSG